MAETIKQFLCRHDWQECSRKHYGSAGGILYYKRCNKCGKVKNFIVKE